jgi:hypothetical protein
LEERLRSALRADLAQHLRELLPQLVGELLPRLAREPLVAQPLATGQPGPARGGPDNGTRHGAAGRPVGTADPVRDEPREGQGDLEYGGPGGPDEEDELAATEAAVRRVSTSLQPDVDWNSVVLHRLSPYDSAHALKFKGKEPLADQKHLWPNPAHWHEELSKWGAAPDLPAYARLPRHIPRTETVKTLQVVFRLLTRLDNGPVHPDEVRRTLVRTTIYVSWCLNAACEDAQIAYLAKRLPNVTPADLESTLGMDPERIIAAAQLSAALGPATAGSAPRLPLHQTRGVAGRGQARGGRGRGRGGKFGSNRTFPAGPGGDGAPGAAN